MKKEEEIKNYCTVSLKAIERAWEKIVKEELQNEQFVLDWLDSLNEISIRN